MLPGSQQEDTSSGGNGSGSGSSNLTSIQTHDHGKIFAILPSRPTDTVSVLGRRRIVE